MSSTSSSECICGDCFNYGPGFGSPGFRSRAPYQTLGHPLIYYAQVQTPYARRRARESRQGSPNCFVKAFRWYTQERGQPQNRELPSDRTDVNGFAVWLDKKYDEFMLDKKDEQNTFQVQPQRTSTLEANKNSTSVVYDMRLKEKFARVRSPWRKRRRQGISKEGGDLIGKYNQSFEFIMTPKQLSRPASECCHPAPRNRSNVSCETQASKKTIIKSHSSDRTLWNDKANGLIEVINPEGYSSKIARSKSEIHSHTAAASEQPARELKNVICQCPEEKIETSDAGVQCTIVDTGSTERHLSDHDKNANKELAYFPGGTSQARGDKDGSEPKKCKELKPCTDNTRSETNMTCMSPEADAKKDVQSQYCQDVTDAVCFCCICDEIITVNQCLASQQKHHRMLSPTYQCLKHTNPLLKMQHSAVMTKNAGTDVAEATSKIYPITFASGAAQTSDHSICFDKHTYPLFMKIVRADKLNEEYIRK